MHGILTRLKLLGFFAALYTALAASANAADMTAIAALRVGDMQKLRISETPKQLTAIGFTDFDGRAMDLSVFHGKVVLLNFWATWCAPCRKEMPMLDALQKELGGQDFVVVTMATGRNPAPAMTRFFDSVGIKWLPLHRDEDQSLARGMGVLGLPTTVILDRQGREVARLVGDADWSSDSAKAILKALIDG